MTYCTTHTDYLLNATNVIGVELVTVDSVGDGDDMSNLSGSLELVNFFVSRGMLRIASPVIACLRAVMISFSVLPVTLTEVASIFSPLS